MADVKCVNPDYALDVSLMMLDYALYKAIEGQFRALAVWSRATIPSADFSARYLASRTETERLIEIFDSLIHLFRKQHPGVELNERIQFSTKILQFLILLQQYCHMSSETLGEEEVLTAQLASRLKDDTTINRLFRQHWLKCRPGREGRNGEELTFHEMHSTNVHVVSIADNLMIRFLEISEELAYGIDVEQTSDKWVQLATGFMLQSAIETIAKDNGSQGELAEAPELKLLRNRLEEYFAWGYVGDDQYLDNANVILDEIEKSGIVLDAPLRSAVEERADLENRIVDTLFRRKPLPETNNDTNMETEPGLESQNWTTAREEAWQKISLTISSMEEADASQRSLPVEMLKESHPLATFVNDLQNFVEKQWRLVSNSQWHGKPILIQIEEGRVDGMSGKDFEAFKRRVDI